MKKIEKKIGFIGGGNMGMALIGGLLTSGVAIADQIAVADVNSDRLEELHEKFDLFTTSDNDKLVDNSDVIVLAVKPQMIDEVTSRLGNLDKPVISIVAGISTARLSENLGLDCPLVRVMPNTPALVGAGASALYFTEKVDSETRSLALNMFKAVGRAVVVEKEQMLDFVTGLSGSGPAYCFLIIDALADGGVRLGLPRALAVKLAAQTLMGSAQLLLETKKHPGELKDMVTSPGGTTAEGLAVLEDSAVRGALAEAVVAAANKARELSGK
jgi:pyrroline-5-carboxylate reductase